MRLLTRLYPDFLIGETDLKIYLCKGDLNLDSSIPEGSPEFSIDRLEYGIDEETNRNYFFTSLKLDLEDYKEFDFNNIVISKDGLILMLIIEYHRQRYWNLYSEINIKVLYDKPTEDNQLYQGKLILDGFIGNDNAYSNEVKFVIDNATEAHSKNGFLMSSSRILMSNDLSVPIQGLSMSNLVPILTLGGFTSNKEVGILIIALRPDALALEPIWINPVNCIYYTERDSLIKILGYKRINKSIFGDLNLTDCYDIDNNQFPNMSGLSNYVISYENGIIRTLIVKDIPTYINGGVFSGISEQDREIFRQIFIDKNLPNFDKKKFLVFQTEDFIAYVDYSSKKLSLYDRRNRQIYRYLMESFDIYESLYGFITKVEYELNSDFDVIGNKIEKHLILNNRNLVSNDYQPKYRIFGHLYVPTYQKAVRDNLDENFTYKDAEGNVLTGYFNKSLLRGLKCMNCKFLRRLVYMP